MTEQWERTVSCRDVHGRARLFRVYLVEDGEWIHDFDVTYTRA